MRKESTSFNHRRFPDLQANDNISDGRSILSRTQLLFCRLKVEAISSREGLPLGNIWLLLLKCLSPAKVLAVYPCFGAPSSLSCSMLLLECMARRGCLPPRIEIADLMEFRGHHFRKLMTGFGSQPLYIPYVLLREGDATDFGDSFVQFLSLTLDQQAEAEFPIEVEFDQLVSLLHYFTYADDESSEMFSQGETGNGRVPDENVFVRERALFLPNLGALVHRRLFWSDDMLMIDRPQKISVQYDWVEQKVLALINGEWVECGREEV